MNKNTKMKLSINLPDDPKVVEASGQIVWSQPFSIGSQSPEKFYAGVEFIDISKEDRERINNYVFSLR